MSICYFKPYCKVALGGRGDTIHGVWFDEEPPYSIYSEGLTRTNKYGQFSILTFTPLMGMSTVVEKFLKNPSKAQKVVNMTIYDADHYTEEEKERIVASYPEHEREARARGIPTMGSGRIYQIPEESIKCQPSSVLSTFTLSMVRISVGITLRLISSYGGIKMRMSFILLECGRSLKTQRFKLGVLLNHGLVKFQ